MTPHSIRFTDAASNFGPPSACAASGEMADKNKVVRRTLRTALSYPVPVPSQFLWTFHRNAGILPWNAQRNAEVRHSARHTRSHGAADAPRHGPAARLRHRAPHRTDQPERAAVERRHAVHRPHAPPGARVDLRKLGE